MKHTLALAILLLAATGWGETNKTLKVTFDPVVFPQLPADFVLELTEIPMESHTNGPSDYSSNIHLTDEGIRKLAASGEICEVLGFHCWEQMPHVTLEYCPDGNYPQHRKCRICGKVETYKGEWK